MRLGGGSRLAAAALPIVLAGCIHTAPIPDLHEGVAASDAGPRSTTIPFLLDDNRVFVRVSFRRRDGAERSTLAFVNLGGGALVLSNRLFRELDAGPDQPLRMRLGTMQIVIDGHDVQPESMADHMALTIVPVGRPPTVREIARGPGGEIAALEAPLPVEAVLPPGVLQHFAVAIDYGARTLTLAAPGALHPDGVAVPIRVNPRTGFALVDATIHGAAYPLVIDSGGSYSVFRPSCPGLLARAAEIRSIGGVGEANFTMAPGGPEIDAPVVRYPALVLGTLRFAEWDAVQMGGNGWLRGWANGLFWKHIYFQKAGEPVCGWIGGNVLEHFRLTLDYPHRISYWREESPLDAHELDQVGIILQHTGGATMIVAVAKRRGLATVAGVKPGDRLLRIDALDTATATRGEILAALHGRPGEVKHLLIERQGRRVTVDSIVTAF